jgi:phosphoribosylaminoimidazole-succinocarboxamide synthase
MQKREKLYEGKAKIVWSTDDPTYVIQEFKDDATAFDGAKKGKIMGKGEVNCRMSAHLFTKLAQSGVPNHFIEMLSPRDMLIKRLNIFLVEVVMRNIAAGSLATRLGLEEGTVMSMPILELYYKRDDLHDPMINTFHTLALKLMNEEELATVQKQAIQVNHLLAKWLLSVGIKLIDFKLEFGKHGDLVLLGDEISPDTCRFWDADTNEKLDKDRFRRDMGGVEQAYQTVLERVLAI